LQLTLSRDNPPSGRGLSARPQEHMVQVLRVLLRRSVTANVGSLELYSEAVGLHRRRSARHNVTLQPPAAGQGVAATGFTAAH
jgi:hypothetical protein